MVNTQISNVHFYKLPWNTWGSNLNGSLFKCLNSYTLKMNYSNGYTRRFKSTLNNKTINLGNLGRTRNGIKILYVGKEEQKVKRKHW